MTTYINIISGFLGAGKTTFLKKIIPNMEGKVVLIENEFGDIGIDGDLIPKELPIKEIYAGCICCSVVQDFAKAIEELTVQYNPNHILIEPSGVGSLSDIIKICKRISKKSDLDIKINHLITIVDAKAFDDYLESFGGFYLDQIRNAQIIFLSHLKEMAPKVIERIISQIRAYNPTVFICEEDWYSYDGEEIIETLNTINSCKDNIIRKSKLIPANKMFGTFSIANPRISPENEIEKMLVSLRAQENGSIFRAKGILELDTKKFVLFNFTPHHYHWEYIEECKETKVVVIGSDLNKEKILEWFE